MGHAVAQLFETLRYKPDVRCFDSRWRHWIFFHLESFFRPHYGPGIDSASGRNEYQEYFPRSTGGQCVRLTPLPPIVLNILEPSGPIIGFIFRKDYTHTAN